MIERVEEALRLQNKYVRVYDDQVRFPSGRIGTHLRISPAGDGPIGVVVVPRWEDQFGLVQVFRYPIGAQQWEFPRGLGIPTDAGVRGTAARELFEEMGATERDGRVLGYVHPDAGLLSHRVGIVECWVTRPTTTTHDTDEVAAATWMPMSQLWAAVRAGIVEDGFTLAALGILAAEAAI